MSGKTKRMIRREAPYWVMGLLVLAIFSGMTFRLGAAMGESTALLMAVNDGIRGTK
jgi:hypothetical protein